MAELLSLNIDCRHRWIKVGIWTDVMYRCHPLLKCYKCGEEKYEHTDCCK